MLTHVVGRCCVNKISLVPFPSLSLTPSLPLSLHLAHFLLHSFLSAMQFNFVTVVEDDEVDEEEAALFWALDNEQPQGWEEEREINYAEMADKSTHSELCVCVCVCVCVRVCACVCVRVHVCMRVSLCTLL